MSYSVNSTVDEVDYTYNDSEKTISANETDTITTTYRKAVNVDTGVSMGSAPYIAALGIAVLGLAVFFLRERLAGRE